MTQQPIGQPPKHTNQLIHEKSPYLLQHAHNPVDWNPWGEVALQTAHQENKPLLISIGYATCHWCHVMERESFEDESVASYLNEHFVPIKVDREERPDVDKIYMDALHAMGQQGGWPLNMFATPDGRPIAGGTYFPPDERHGRMPFRRVLETLVEAWQNQRGALLQNAARLTEHLQKRSALSVTTAVSWESSVTAAAVRQFTDAYDARFGGFVHNGPNKFPPCMGLMLLLRHHAHSGDRQALEMTEHTLRQLYHGGIYDQIGGGLSRYSTDHQWLVPHFEKMLYDNALFTQALTETYLVTQNTTYQELACDVIAYVTRDLGTAKGAFSSAEDADSEGEEGKFYLWTPETMAAVLDEPLLSAALTYWNITAAGNFERGQSIPHVTQDIDTVAQQVGTTPQQLQERLTQSRGRLLAARSQRIRPLRDDKVLVSWNALMVSALVKAGVAFAEQGYVDQAAGAAKFLLEHCRRADGRLLRRYREGEARYPAYLVDYAQLAAACLDLYQATFDPAWFSQAEALMRDANRLFRNPIGPYYDTGEDAERLIARTVDGYDGVEPSGNSTMALNALRLQAYGVAGDWEADALRIFSAFKDYLEQAGSGHAAMLSALDFYLAQPLEVAVVGDPGAVETQMLLETLQCRFHRAIVVAFATPQDVETHGKTIPLLAGRQAIGGRPTAYVCRDRVCQLPVHDPQALTDQLNAQELASPG